jgi:propionyl-CoA synthetase
MEKYQEIFNRSLEEPDAFWAEAAESIDWYKKWDTVLDSSNSPFYRWFRGGELNQDEAIPAWID